MPLWVELLAACKYAHDAAGLGYNVHHGLDRRWALHHSAAATATTSASTAVVSVSVSMSMISRPTAFRRHSTSTDRIRCPRTTATATSGRLYLKDSKTGTACPVPYEHARCARLVSMLLRRGKWQRDGRYASGASLWLGWCWCGLGECGEDDAWFGTVGMLDFPTRTAYRAADPFGGGGGSRG
jgi:hypothetical protein